MPKKNGKIIIPRSIEETKIKLQKIFKNLKINVTETDIEKITDKVSYKAITIKDAQRYMFEHYNVEYTKDLIDSLYDIRNRLMHGRDFDTEYNILFEGINLLFSLIDRTILMMLDWKGEKYQNKTNRGYKETQLKK